MTTEQQNIYDGLKNIGEAIANYYKDGVDIISPKNTLSSKANLIAHLAREIDGGLRDVFAPDFITNEKKELLKTPGKKNERNGHFASILAAVNKSDKNNALAKKWHSIAENFAAMAHRYHIHASSRDPAEMIDLWIEYEKVLSVVIGSFIAITNGLDNLLKLDVPQLTILPALKNILKKRENDIYFFTRLDKVLWLQPLIDHGFFKIEEKEIQAGIQQGPGDWPPIKYLVKISGIGNAKTDDVIKGIVNTIMNKYVTGEFSLHAFTVDDILQLIIKIPDFAFTEKERKFFELFIQQNGPGFVNLLHGNMAEFLTKKYTVGADKDSLIELLRYFLGFTITSEPAISFFGEENPAPYLLRKPNVEVFYVRDNFRRHGQAIMELIGEDAIRTAVRQLVSLHQSGAHAITEGSPASIEESSQTQYNNGWEDQLVYFIRDYAGSLPADILDKLLDEMLFSKVQILQRVAVHLIRIHFDTYSDLWWKFVASPDIFESPYVHEPFLLLEEHSGKFSDDEFKNTIAWIENILLRDSEPTEDDGYDHIAYRIRRWFCALKPSSIASRKLLQERNDIYFKRNPGEMTDHPEFYSYGTSHQGYDYPLEFEVFNEMTIEGQVKYIREFIPAHDFDTSRDGLAHFLRSAIKLNPHKYIFSIDFFIELPDLYLAALLNAFTELLNKDGLTGFAFILDFIENKIATVSFNKQRDDTNFHKRWLISAIGHFVSTVAENASKFDIDESDASRMIELLISILENDHFQGEKDEMRNGYINYVLNSMHGKLYSALIAMCALWVKEFSNKSDTVKWPPRIKNHFTGRLTGTKTSDVDFSITLGLEMPRILFWDKQWVVENLAKIFDENNSAFLDYRLYSMFNNNNYLPSAPFYQFLKEHALFNLAIQHFTSESWALKVLLNYGLMEWRFWKGDPEKDSIIATVFQLNQPHQIKELILVAWETKLLSCEQVLYLWERILALPAEPPGLRAFNLVISLFDLMPAISQKVFDLATDTISQISDTSISYNFLRHLYLIADSNYELAGRLLIQVYERKLAGPFNEPELKGLVKKMYEIGLKTEADRVCILLGEQGSLKLKDVYNENN